MLSLRRLSFSVQNHDAHPFHNSSISFVSFTVLYYVLISIDSSISLKESTENRSNSISKTKGGSFTMGLPTPPPMPVSSLPACPFIAGSMITNPRLFVGRKDELHSITTLMTGAQPTSINLIGQRRIGKSSLLYHFFQTWEQRVQDAPK